MPYWSTPKARGTIPIVINPKKKLTSLLPSLEENLFFKELIVNPNDSNFSLFLPLELQEKKIYFFWGYRTYDNAFLQAQINDKLLPSNILHLL